MGRAAQDWFVLSFEDGGLTSTSCPSNPKPLPWIERDLENILALNPSFLDVDTYLPLRLQGVRGTVTSPDQAFVDELGRIAVVEVKKTHAHLSVLAQVSGYAAHWQLLPPAEIESELDGISNEKERLTKFGSALREIIEWASARGDSRGVDRLAKYALDRLAHGWVRDPARFAALTEGRHTSTPLPLIGAPPRLIVVAAGFTEECIEFAEQLTQTDTCIWAERSSIAIPSLSRRGGYCAALGRSRSSAENSS